MSMDDLVYRGLKSGLAWLKEIGAQRVLVRGELTGLDVEELEALDADVRQLPPGYSGGNLFDGLYGVYRKGRWEALVIRGEGQERPNGTAPAIDSLRTEGCVTSRRRERTWLSSGRTVCPSVAQVRLGPRMS